MTAAPKKRPTTGSRGLTADEYAAAYRIFADTLDNSAITVVRGGYGSMDQTSRAIGNTIYMSEDEFDGDKMTLNQAGLYILIHEMTHVWQYRHQGWTYAPSALWAQLKAGRPETATPRMTGDL